MSDNGIMQLESLNLKRCMKNTNLVSHYSQPVISNANIGRKAAEIRCQSLDEQIELNEVALIDARRVAEDSNHKYEETARKSKIVTHHKTRIFN